MKTNSQDKLVIKPIDQFIEPFKRKSAVHYGFHSYFTTQPFNVVQEYIKNFTNANELVADPFVGSGVTAVEALRLKRRCFALDLNPFAVFLTKAKCSYANINKLTNMFNSILKRIESKCEEVEKIPLEDSTNIEIPYWYPNNVLLPSDSDVLYLHEIFTKKQLFQLSLIKSQIDQFPSSNEKDLLLILFCGTLSRANMAYSLPADGRTIYSGDFTIFHTGRYRIPKKIAEIPVLPVFKRRFLDIIKAKKETNADFRGYVNKRTLQLVEGSATNLKPYLTDSSVDYVYTDPPYGGHIKYLDLSTIYNAWLNLDVTEEMRTQEAIEGGERKHTFKQYMELMSQSLSEISRILKQDRWLSLIYHYREPYLWTNIVETARKVGLEYQNSVVQHTKLPSWHKIDVPQTVLSSQMVINFQRKYNPFFEFKRDNLTLQQLIFNVAEREIIKRDGATLEDIINALIPELFEHNFDDQTQTRTDKVFSLLAQEFRYDNETQTFQIDRERGKKLGSYIPLKDRVNYYLISYLRRKQKATLEEIIPYILPRVINGETPSGQEILEELKKIAHFDGYYWVFREEAGFQSSFDLSSEKLTTEAQIPQISEHNQMIYRLALLASKYGFIPKIGNQEQKEPFLKAINLCADLHFDSVSDKDNSYINNIDCLWMTKAHDKPLYAFEVEHSTNIRDAFERFLSLLKVVADVGYNRNLMLVISKANRQRFDVAIRQSSYIGAPHYINNKIRYIFEETLTSRFNELLQEKDHTKFTGILSSPELG
jgi:DNA modification methylase